MTVGVAGGLMAPPYGISVQRGDAGHQTSDSTMPTGGVRRSGRAESGRLEIIGRGPHATLKPAPVALWTPPGQRDADLQEGRWTIGRTDECPAMATVLSISTFSLVAAAE